MFQQDIEHVSIKQKMTWGTSYQGSHTKLQKGNQICQEEDQYGRQTIFLKTTTFLTT